MVQVRLLVKEHKAELPQAASVIASACARATQASAVEEERDNDGIEDDLDHDVVDADEVPEYEAFQGGLYSSSA